MSSKTKKEREVKTNNTTRKAWKKDATQTAFKINNVHILDKNDDNRVRMEQLKPGTRAFLHTIDTAKEREGVSGAPRYIPLGRKPEGIVPTIE